MTKPHKPIRVEPGKYLYRLYGVQQLRNGRANNFWEVMDPMGRFIGGFYTLKDAIRHIDRKFGT